MASCLTTLKLRRSWALGIVSGSLLFGCVEQPGAQRITGPDGTTMLHVHCGEEQVACFRIAGERCPNGYDLSAIFDPHDGNFLVRCRAPQMTPLVSSVVERTRPAAASSAPSNDGWPPVEVARPAEPWPTHAEATPTPREPVETGH